ncbi:hypothetical protein [Chelativorans salis]|uniref:Uncharacterized protein n=1 Tax=Chelativorans salis TaxID=2978478 RepID=A0ABT2LQN0_9HYPH|nr:hypothetical protein [Chelativorans sp. EGI FJ00035]MCT7376855.1 hypothetical protein [Chelativorans sp. EGI FJ00035]
MVDIRKARGSGSLRETAGRRMVSGSSVVAGNVCLREVAKLASTADMVRKIVVAFA